MRPLIRSPSVFACLGYYQMHEELRIREEEAAREWQCLQDTLNKVARGRSEDEEIHAFRLLQHQAVAIGQRRVELQNEMAHLEGRRT